MGDLFERVLFSARTDHRLTASITLLEVSSPTTGIQKPAIYDRLHTNLFLRGTKRDSRDCFRLFLCFGLWFYAIAIQHIQYVDSYVPYHVERLRLWISQNEVLGHMQERLDSSVDCLSIYSTRTIMLFMPDIATYLPYQCRHRNVMRRYAMKVWVCWYAQNIKTQEC